MYVCMFMCVYRLEGGYIFLRAQSVKKLPAMQETGVRFLGWEDSLEKEMTTHSSILAWRIPWTEKPSRLQSMGSQRVSRDWTHTHTHPNFIRVSTELGRQMSNTSACFPDIYTSQQEQWKTQGWGRAIRHAALETAFLGDTAMLELVC